MARLLRGDLEDGLLLHADVSDMGSSYASGVSHSTHQTYHHLTPAQLAEIEEERSMIRKRCKDPSWRLDRGAGYYASERVRNKRQCLVQTGRHAGRSRVRVTGLTWRQLVEHKLRRDFFNSATNAPLHSILITLACIYFTALTVWGSSYYILWRINDTCFEGFHGAVSAYLFALETQQTIGYGTRAPGDCWATLAMVAMHSLVTVVLDSLILGITFARLSHPKNRGRTILISDCAVIARRDGELKFMFRVADIQPRQVAAPSVSASLFTWGHHKQGRMTAEGESIPVTVQEIPLQGLDPTLLLPVAVEHTIDERSPLAGHTPKTLEAVGAEIVIMFSAVTELGDTFCIRQSYLPSEIHWGHVFVPVVEHAPDGETQHSVDIARFHDVEPQPGLDLVPPSKLAAKVMAATDRGTLPQPVYGGNTLVLSEVAVVGTRNGHLLLMFRVGDVYPGGQVLDVSVSAYLYRWQPYMTDEGEVMPYSFHSLELSPDKPYLRYPVTVAHDLTDPDSPLSSWVSAAAKRADSDAEILVIVQGVSANDGRPLVRQRVYPVLTGVRWGTLFLPVVQPHASAVSSTRARQGGASRIDWSAFHCTMPAQMDAVMGNMALADRQGDGDWHTAGPSSRPPSVQGGSPHAPGSAPAATHSASQVSLIIPDSPVASAAAMTQPTPRLSPGIPTGRSTSSSAAVPTSRPPLPPPSAAAEANLLGDEVPGSFSMWGAGGSTGALSGAARTVSNPAPPRANRQAPLLQQVVTQQGQAAATTASALAKSSNDPFAAYVGSLSVAVPSPAAQSPSKAVRVSSAADTKASNLDSGTSSRRGRSSSGLGSTLKDVLAAQSSGGLQRAPSAVRMQSAKSETSLTMTSQSGPEGGSTADLAPDDWRVTRSLFAAMEEMTLLAQQETADERTQSPAADPST